MSLLDFLPLLAGIGMFLYGMDMLAKAIERLAGARLEKILESLTNNKWKGLALGTGVTAVIQSSAATTITVIGFVNAGMMGLAQAIPVVFGANIGSTATAQILRLGDLNAGGVILSLLKPSTFAPALIIAGAAINLIAKKRQTKNVAMLLMGFGLLFFGMTTMEETLSPLQDVPAFQQIFTSFENPVLGILAGTLLTCLIQSSSAAVGILQALTATGSVTFATCFPMLLGINIGKCFTVILASFGTSKDSKRVVVVHLLFNIFGAVLFAVIFYTLNAFLHFGFLQNVLTRGNVADLHTGFNLIVALILMPAIQLLISISKKFVPEKEEPRESFSLDYLDEHFQRNPQLAMDQCKKVIDSMGRHIQENLKITSRLLSEGYIQKEFDQLQENEHFLDLCETGISDYLIQTTHHTLTEDESHLATELLHAVSEFERIGDYCVRIAETIQYMSNNDIHFTEAGMHDADLVLEAIRTLVDQTFAAFSTEESDVLDTIEPLNEVIDQITELLNNNHVERLRNGDCTVTSGISFIELLNNSGQIARHCSNIGVYIIQRQKVFESFDRHAYLKELRRGSSPAYQKYYEEYRDRFLRPLEDKNGSY